MEDLRKYMYKKDLTIANLSKLLKCSPPTVCRILSGKKPSERMLYKINQLMSEK